ncbi:MAG: DUF126 domain-containing protein [Thermodesulfobacteriota bacterium]
MKTLAGKPVLGGKGSGPALVSITPINFTAAFSKPQNILPGRHSEIRDRHHELFGKKIAGTVLVFPAAVGSTYTGMMLLDLMYRGQAPVAMIVQKADSLLVSGPVLAEVWFSRGIPVVQYENPDLFSLIKTGDRVAVDGDKGTITIEAK